MPISGGEERHRHRLIRRVVCVRGAMSFTVECEPRFDYARAPHETTRHEHGVVFRSKHLGLALEGSVELELTESGGRADFTLASGESTTTYPTVIALTVTSRSGSTARHIALRT